MTGMIFSLVLVNSLDDTTQPHCRLSICDRADGLFASSPHGFPTMWHAAHGSFVKVSIQNGYVMQKHRPQQGLSAGECLDMLDPPCCVHTSCSNTILYSSALSGKDDISACLPSMYLSIIDRNFSSDPASWGWPPVLVKFL